MNCKQIFKIILLFLILTSKNVYSQENNPQTSSVTFFLDCEDCDFTYVRQELSFISFVRDPQLADVHILVTDSNTGSGGNKYFLNFIGNKKFKDLNYDYTVITKQSDTDDDIRKALLKLIKIGILPYYSKSGFLDNISVDLEEIENRKADNMVSDPWEKWVFNIESAGELQKEESQNEYSASINFNTKKVTEEWKTKIEASYEINRENYFDDGEKISNKQDTKEISADLVKSITDKWSAGVFGNYLSQTFLNTQHKIGVSSGIEYNFFPWKECNRRVFAIRYGAGAEFIDYMEVTIYEKMKETVFGESLEINLELIQPWGEISLGLEGRHSFHDFSKNRLTFESDFSIRLSKNLSVFCEIQSEVIHDQLYLPKGDASLEDILLKRRKLATTYEINSQLGFRFTFGSIYNNVVNERF